MNSDFLALALFVVITIFTPGPNNITSASMGVLYGYKQSLRYLSGIVSGFFLVMLLLGWISSKLLLVFPSFEAILRVIGAVYILWLAYHTLKASYSFDEGNSLRLGFSHGFFLQILNPKALIFGMTLYSTFLKNTVTNPVFLFISAVTIATIAFCATSSWVLFGATIRTYLNHSWVRRSVNLVLSLLLVYTAIELSGILDYLFP